MLSQPKDRWSIVLTIAALVHLFGITFYAIFASGELQPWAEPTPIAEGRPGPVLTPSKIGYTEETSFNVRSHKLFKFILIFQHYFPFRIRMQLKIRRHRFTQTKPATVQHNMWQIIHLLRVLLVI